MTNNDILRRIRYIFNLNDQNMAAIWPLAGVEVAREQVTAYLKKDDDPAFQPCSDLQLANFLNGFIVKNRGKSEGEQPKAESSLTNNLIFLKLKIALELRSDDIINILKLADLSISPHELSAFFRRPGHKHYRLCKDQILRNFLTGLQLQYRDRDKQATKQSGFQWKVPGKK